MVKIIAVSFFLFFLALQSQASDINDKKFPDANWNPEVYSFFLYRPVIIDIGEKFDIPEPPLNDSEETQSELKYLRELSIDNRDEETIRRIQFENQKFSMYEIFMNEGLVSFLDGNLREFLNVVDGDVRYIVLRYKKKFMRPRPSDLDADLDLAIPNPGHPAYPSGHATQSYAIALVLADFDPDNAEKYMQFARDIAKRREIAGVHYPSDSEAGQKLAVQIIDRIKRDLKFGPEYQRQKELFQTLNR